MVKTSSKQMSYLMIKCCYRLCLASLLLVLVGCATHTDYPTYPAPQPEPEPTEPAPVIVKPQPDAVVTPPAPAVALNPAALSLAKQARGQYQSQDYQGAIATAERGLRIERRAADLYLLLAQSYVQLGLPDRARMFVQQGLRFALPGTDAAEGLQRVKQILDGY
jgi:Flp pilus assembly protein TadD